MQLHTAALAAATAVLCAGVAGAAEYEVAPLATDTVEVSESPKTRDNRPRVGVYGAAGFPSPLSLGALVMIDRRFLLGGEYGFLPVSQIAGVDVTYRSFAADARWFPFRGGPLFLGVRAGRQHLSGSKTVTVSGYGSATGTTTADSWFLNPRIGLFKMWDSGFFIGADVGLKVPIGHSHTEQVPYGLPMPEAITTIRDTMSAKVIPTITLLQLGIAL